MKIKGFSCYDMKHIAGITHNPTEKAVIERSNEILKVMLDKQKGVVNIPINRFHNALLTSNFMNDNEKGITGITAVGRH